MKVMYDNDIVRWYVIPCKIFLSDFKQYFLMLF